MQTTPDGLIMHELPVVGWAVSAAEHNYKVSELAAQLAACQSREAKAKAVEGPRETAKMLLEWYSSPHKESESAVEEMAGCLVSFAMRFERPARDVSAATDAMADRDQLQAQVGALHTVLCKCVLRLAKEDCGCTDKELVGEIRAVLAKSTTSLEDAPAALNPSLTTSTPDPVSDAS